MRLIVFFLPLLLFCFFDNEASNIDKIHSYINKSKFEKAESLLLEELSFYPVQNDSSSNPDIYNFMYYAEESILDPDLCYAAYLLISRHHIISFDTLDIIHWYINKAREYLNHEGFVDSKYINKYDIKAINEIIDSLAYEILKRNYTYQNIEHFMSVYGADYYLPNKISNLKYEYYLLHLKADIKNCDANPECIKNICLYHLKRYDNEDFNMLINKKLDSIEYFHEGVQKNIQSIVNFISAHPKSTFIEQAKHLFFKRYFSKIAFTNKSLFHFINTYKGFYVKDKCPYNPYFWLDLKSKNKEYYKNFKNDKNFPKKLFNLYSNPYLEDDLILTQNSKTKQYGFKNINNQSIVSFNYEDIDKAYLFKVIKDDFLKVYIDDKLEVINRFGEVIIPKEKRLDDVQNFNAISLLTYEEGLYGLYNKNGFEILPPEYEEITVFSHNLLKVKKDGRWGVINYLKDIFIPFQYDEINEEPSNFIFAYTDPVYDIFHIQDSLGYIICKNSALATDYNYFNKGIRIKNLAGKFSVLNLDSKIIIKDADNISAFQDGWIVKKENTHVICNKNGNKISGDIKELEEIKSNQNYIAIKIKGKWGLNNLKGEIIFYPHYKEIDFVGKESVILENKERQKLYYNQNILIEVGQKDIEIIETYNKDDKQVYFIKMASNGKKSLFNINNLHKPILYNYNNIKLLDSGISIITRNNRSNCVNVLLPKTPLLKTTYQEIIVRKDGLLNIFKDSKFGLFNPLEKWLIPNHYEALLTAYTDTIFKAKKNGFWGLISKENTPLSDFIFEEIIYYNDTLAIVRLSKSGSDHFHIYDIKNQQLGTFYFENYIIDKAKIIFLKDDKMGILGASTESILNNKYRYIVQLDQEIEDLFLSIEILDRTYALNWHNAKGKIINTLQLSAPKFKTVQSILEDKIYTF